MENKQYIDIRLLKDLMEKRHMGHRQLAERMGVMPNAVKSLLCGDQSSIDGDVYGKLARIFDISLHLLIHKD